MKKYEKKIEMFKFAFTSYQKILNKISAYRCGKSFNLQDPILKFHDDQVTDLCPLADKYKKKYVMKFKTT